MPFQVLFKVAFGGKLFSADDAGERPLSTMFAFVNNEI
jgi:hypothetical protein